MTSKFKSFSIGPTAAWIRVILENKGAIRVDSPSMTISNGRNIVLLSDGTPSRTFCYIADAIVGYFKILVKGQPAESYNIGVETPEISMRELANRLAKAAARLFGYEGSIVHECSADAEYLVDNPNRRCPDISKARSQLGYEPKIDIDDGLNRTLVWYAGNRNAHEA